MQVESDKEVFLFKIVSTNQRVENLKAELEIVMAKEAIASESIISLKAELAIVIEAEKNASSHGGHSMHGYSIHNSDALGETANYYCVAWFVSQ